MPTRAKCNRRSRELAALRAEIARLQAVVDKLPKTADLVPIVPGMKLWMPGRCGPATATLRGQFEAYPIYAEGWGMNVAGGAVYSTREAADVAKES